MQSSVQEIYQYDPPILEIGQKCCQVCEKGFFILSQDNAFSEQYCFGI